MYLKQYPQTSSYPKSENKYLSQLWRWSYCNLNQTSRSNLDQGFGRCPLSLLQGQYIQYCPSHNSLPSFPSGLSLYLICPTLHTQHWPYLLSPERHFKPSRVTHSGLQVRSEQTIQLGSQKCGFSNTLICSHISTFWTASHLQKTKQWHWQCSPARV